MILSSFSEFLFEKEVISVNPKNKSQFMHILNEELTDMHMKELPGSIDFKNGDMRNFDSIIIDAADQRGALLLGDLGLDAPEIREADYKNRFYYHRFDNGKQRTLFLGVIPNNAYKKSQKEYYSDWKGMFYITKSKELGDDLMNRLTDAHFVHKGQIWNIEMDWKDMGRLTDVRAVRKWDDFGGSPDKTFDERVYFYEFSFKYTEGGKKEMISYDEFKKLEYYKKILDLGFEDVTGPKSIKSNNYAFKATYFPDATNTYGDIKVPVFAVTMFAITSSGYIRKGTSGGFQPIKKIKAPSIASEWNESLKILYDFMVEAKRADLKEIEKKGY